MITSINGQLSICYCYHKPRKIRQYKHKSFKYSLLLLLIGIFLLPNFAYFSDISTTKIIELTNKERERIGLNTLTVNPLLEKAAREKGQDILQNQIFQHNFANKKFSSWIKNTGYNYLYVGENLAIDFYTSEGAIKAWMASPTHKRNLINPKFTEIGIATIDGDWQGQKTTLIVQIFGTPLNNLPGETTKNNFSEITKNYSFDSSKLSITNKNYSLNTYFVYYFMNYFLLATLLSFALLTIYLYINYLLYIFSRHQIHFLKTG